jgi:ATP-dependent 26S proteasome regulatory subunit
MLAAIDRDDDSPKASLAGMLNALDGVWTPHGLVTVLTTNHVEALDDALIRAGRVDVSEEFTVLDLDQAKRLTAFCGTALDVKSFVGRSPAELIELARQQIGGER